MKRIFIFTFFLALGLIFFAHSVLALTISPAKFLFSADPGQTLEDSIKIRNDSDRALTFYPEFQLFTVQGNGEPVFLDDKSGLASWIETIPSELTIEPGQSKRASVLIKVPEDAEPGGHYAVIFWSSKPPVEKGGTSVGIVMRVGALVLLRVSGNVIEKGELISFEASQKVFNFLPVNFSYAIKNEGTIHIGPTGQVIIKNIFGKTAASLRVNPGEFNVLPGKIRTLETGSWLPKAGLPEGEETGFFADLKREWKGFAFGYYRANLNLEYGQEPLKTIKSSFGFWVIPWRILLIGTLILALLIIGGIKGFQKYNDWVINKAVERLDKVKKRKKVKK